MVAQVYTHQITKAGNMAVLQVRSRKLRKSSYKIKVTEQMPELRLGLRLCDRQQNYMLLSTWVIGSVPSGNQCGGNIHRLGCYPGDRNPPTTGRLPKEVLSRPRPA